jgi:hypothetical protein
VSQFNKQRIARGLPKIPAKETIIFDRQYFDDHAVVCEEFVRQWNESSNLEFQANVADAILNAGHLPPRIVKRIQDSSNGGQDFKPDPWIVASVRLESDLRLALGMRDYLILTGCQSVYAGFFLADNQEISLLVEAKTGKILRVR